jgi:hypothetical protein
VSTTLSCGQCGSPVRPDQSWCSLCYATIQPAVDPLTAPLEEVIGLDHAVDETLGGTEELETVVMEAATEEVPPPQVFLGLVPEGSGAELALSEVDVMLSMLAAEHRQNERAADLADRLSDKSTRVTVMVGGTLVVGLLLFGVLTALGALF